MQKYTALSKWACFFLSTEPQTEMKNQYAKSLLFPDTIDFKKNPCLRDDWWLFEKVGKCLKSESGMNS
jgi:hypothetical protein